MTGKLASPDATRSAPFGADTSARGTQAHRGNPLLASQIRRSPAVRRILSLLILLTLLIAACGGGGESTDTSNGTHDNGHKENTDSIEGARSIAVNATSFEFDPTTIEAEAGEAIEITLTAADAEHDFVIDDLGAHIGAEAGETATGGFEVGDEPGTYTYYCSVAGHRDAGMEGKLVVD